jgi:hypothetical protein
MAQHIANDDDMYESNRRSLSHNSCHSAGSGRIPLGQHCTFNHVSSQHSETGGFEKVSS